MRDLDQRSGQHALLGQQQVMPHIAEEIDEEVDARQRREGSQDLVITQGDAIHANISQEAERRLREEHGCPVLAGFGWRPRHIAYDDETHAEAGQRRRRHHQPADRAIDAVLAGTKQDRQADLPEIKRALAKDAGYHQRADITSRASGIAAGHGFRCGQCQALVRRPHDRI